MVEISDLSKISSAITQYVVRPLNAFGLGGFIFDIEGDTSISLISEITDHYTENNVAVQDHIAVAPLRIQLRHYVGELVHLPNGGGGKKKTQKLVQKLTVISSYLPSIATSAQQAVDLFNGKLTTDSIYPTLTNKLLDLWTLTKNLHQTKGKQQQAYAYLKSLQQQKILVSVQTPFEFIPNMAIESIVATQDENNSFVSSFEITLKQMRFASTITKAYDKSLFADSRVAEQMQPLENKGTVPTAVPDTSLLMSGAVSIRNLFGVQ
jgi:hypothetical protein